MGLTSWVVQSHPGECGPSACLPSCTGGLQGLPGGSVGDNGLSSDHSCLPPSGGRPYPPSLPSLGGGQTPFWPLCALLGPHPRHQPHFPPSCSCKFLLPLGSFRGNQPLSLSVLFSVILLAYARGRLKAAGAGSLARRKREGQGWGSPTPPSPKIPLISPTSGTPPNAPLLYTVAAGPTRHAHGWGCQAWQAADLLSGPLPCIPPPQGPGTQLSPTSNPSTEPVVRDLRLRVRLCHQLEASPFQNQSQSAHSWWWSEDRTYFLPSCCSLKGMCGPERAEGITEAPCRAQDDLTPE